MNRKNFVLPVCLALAVVVGWGSFAAGAQTTHVDQNLIEKLSQAKVAAVGQPLVLKVKGTRKQVCSAEGNSGQPSMKMLNNKKNRTDAPSATQYIEVPIAQMKVLPTATPEEIEGAPVEVVGYLSHQIKVEKDPPGESCNCLLNLPVEVDWHIYLTEKPNQPISKAVIVETTPRVRLSHSWDPEMLKPYVNQPKLVRVSGWLLFDKQHLNVVGKERATVWEVHPITRFEVQDAQGHWIDIEKQ